MSLLMETTRRVDLLVAEGQSQGRAPTLVAGIVRDGALVHFAAAGELLRPERSMQYRIGSITKTMTAVLIMQLRDRGPARPRRPAGGAPARHPGRRGHPAPAARPRRRAAARAGGPVVGTRRRRRSHHAAGRAHPRQAQPPAAPGVPLLQPRVRPARRGRRGPHRARLGRAAHRAGPRAARNDAAPPTGSRRPTPPATSCTPGTTRCARSRGPTPARWPRPGSSGRRPRTWRRWAAFLAVARPGGARPADRSPRCACR